jgi:hypothetical protein
MGAMTWNLFNIGTIGSWVDFTLITHFTSSILSSEGYRHRRLDGEAACLLVVAGLTVCFFIKDNTTEPAGDFFFPAQPTGRARQGGSQWRMDVSAQRSEFSFGLQAVSGRGKGGVRLLIADGVVPLRGPPAFGEESVDAVCHVAWYL